MDKLGLDLDGFDVLTFDCYGTLIDWESGLLAAYRQALGPLEPVGDRLLEAHARHETRWEAGEYIPYRQVLSRTLHDVAADMGSATMPNARRTEAFALSVADWPAFPDSAAALAALAQRYRLGVITNCDDDLFEASRRRLGISFDYVVTAQRARSYKPARRNFELALQLIDRPPARILHVAQSLFHDHAPAHELGLATAWIDRRQGVEGFGATPPSSARADLSVPDMATFARLALARNDAKEPVV
ncbi:MAG TPA: haloacid dehalogenase type II [Candidatus Limnocylindria bacterium]|nr:haloacid dehalogenase type II [Candidatus Limnocylindria bacterium]